LNNIYNDEDIEIIIQCYIHNLEKDFRLFIDICDKNDQIIIRSFVDEALEIKNKLHGGNNKFKVVIPKNILLPIEYKIYVQAGVHNIRYCIPYNQIYIPIKVLDQRMKRLYPTNPDTGLIDLDMKWRLNE